jgi:hypothetical protein
VGVCGKEWDSSIGRCGEEWESSIGTRGEEWDSSSYLWRSSGRAVYLYVEKRGTAV